MKLTMRGRQKAEATRIPVVVHTAREPWSPAPALHHDFMTVPPTFSHIHSRTHSSALR
jgi:hypothetical protein